MEEVKIRKKEIQNSKLSKHTDFLGLTVIHWVIIIVVCLIVFALFQYETSVTTNTTTNSMPMEKYKLTVNRANNKGDLTLTSPGIRRSFEY